MQIVDHQDDRLLEGVQVGQQSLDHRLAAEARRGGDPLHQPVLADRAGELVDDRQPEALRVSLATFDGDPCDPVAQPLGRDPRSQQDGLAASRGRAHEHDSARGRRQPVEQRRARHQPTSRAPMTPSTRHTTSAPFQHGHRRSDGHRLHGVRMESRRAVRGRATGRAVVTAAGRRRDTASGSRLGERGAVGVDRSPSRLEGRGRRAAVPP